MPVQKVDHGEADGSGKKAVDGVQNGIPSGKCYIKVIHLTENFSGKNKNINDSLEQRRNLNLELLLHEAGNQEQKEHQCAYPDTLVIALENLTDQNTDDENPQYGIKQKNPGTFFDMIFQPFGKLTRMDHKSLLNKRIVEP